MKRMGGGWWGEEGIWLVEGGWGWLVEREGGWEVAGVRKEGRWLVERTMGGNWWEGGWEMTGGMEDGVASSGQFVI